MAFFKRIFLFAATNIAIMAMVTIVIQVLGIGPQMTENGLNYGNLMAICLVCGYGWVIDVAYDVKANGILVHGC